MWSTQHVTYVAHMPIELLLQISKKFHMIFMLPKKAPKNPKIAQVLVNLTKLDCFHSNGNTT